MDLRLAAAAATVEAVEADGAAGDEGLSLDLTVDARRLEASHGRQGVASLSSPAADLSRREEGLPPVAEHDLLEPSWRERFERVMVAAGEKATSCLLWAPTPLAKTSGLSFTVFLVQV